MEAPGDTGYRVAALLQLRRFFKSSNTAVAHGHCRDAKFRENGGLLDISPGVDLPRLRPRLVDVAPRIQHAGLLTRL